MHVVVRSDLPRRSGTIRTATPRPSCPVSFHYHARNRIRSAKSAFMRWMIWLNSWIYIGEALRPARKNVTCPVRSCLARIKCLSHVLTE